MSRYKNASTVFVVAIWFLASTQVALAKKGKPEPGEKRQEEFLSAIDEVAAAVKKRAKKNRAALGNVLAVVDEEDLKIAASSLQPAIYERLLRQGVLAFNCDEEHQVQVGYEDGKLPKEIVSKETVDYLAEKKVPWLIVPKLEVSDDKYSLTVEMVDVRKRRFLPRGKQVSFSSEGIEFDELVKFDGLPELNLAILDNAIANISEQVGRGECWDLPALPMREHGVHVFQYHFGKKIEWDDAVPGDVVTFGISGETGGHVAVLLSRPARPEKAILLHQGEGVGRVVVFENLGRLKTAMADQPVKFFRPGKPQPEGAVR